MHEPIARWRRSIEVALVLGLHAAMSIVAAYTQPALTKNSGEGDDGVDYCLMARQFAAGQKTPAARAPYVYRVGTPFLASLVDPQHIVPGFLMVNLVASVMAAMLFLWWLRLRVVSPAVRVLLCGLFITQWHAPTRFVHFYPAYVDPWGWVSILAGLVCLEYVAARPSVPTVAAFSVVAFLGVFFREVALVAPTALLFATNPLFGRASHRVGRSRSRIPPAAYVLPLACGIAALVLTHHLGAATNSYDYLGTALHFARTKSWRYLHAWFIAFGPILALLLYEWRLITRLLLRDETMAACLAAFALLGLIGGTDTERILYWSAPVVYVLLGQAIERRGHVLRSWPLLVVLAASQAVSQRLLWRTPAYPNVFDHRFPLLTPWGAHFPYLDLYSSLAEPSVALASFCEYAVLTLVCLVWFRARDRAAQWPGPA